MVEAVQAFLWPDALPDANPLSGLAHYPLVFGHWGGSVF